MMAVWTAANVPEQSHAGVGLARLAAIMRRLLSSWPAVSLSASLTSIVPQREGD